jgi:hypothetical protein
MNGVNKPAEEISPAERRLIEHLELLRATPPLAAPELLARIVRRARWQREIRDPLVLIGSAAAAFADGLHLLFEHPLDGR